MSESEVRLIMRFNDLCQIINAVISQIQHMYYQEQFEKNAGQCSIYLRITSIKLELK